MYKAVGWIVVLVAVVGGLWYVLSQGSDAPAGSAIQNTEETSPTANETPAATAGVTITYTDAGFSPSSVTVSVGQPVTWVNQSSKKMWVASAMHPTHTAYDGTTLAEHCANGAPQSSAVFDECSGGEPGARFTFTFDKAGTWKYHDHIDATKFGSVVVTAAAGAEASASANLNVELR